jgi:hypothetical protein
VIQPPPGRLIADSASTFLTASERCTFLAKRNLDSLSLDPRRTNEEGALSAVPYSVSAWTGVMQLGLSRGQRWWGWAGVLPFGWARWKVCTHMGKGG